MTDKLSSVERIGIPVILLGATYGIFGTVLDAWEKLNARRDSVIAPPIPVNDGFRLIVFWSDWLPMTVGLCIFLFSFTVITFMVPEFAAFSDKRLAKNTRISCWLVAGLTGFGFLAFSVLAFYDGYKILNHH